MFSSIVFLFAWISLFNTSIINLKYTNTEAFINKIIRKKVGSLLYSGKKYFPYSKKYLLYLDELSKKNNTDNYLNQIKKIDDVFDDDFKTVEHYIKKWNNVLTKKKIMNKQIYHENTYFINNDQYENSQKTSYEENQNYSNEEPTNINDETNDEKNDETDDEYSYSNTKSQKKTKSKNFEVIKNFPTKFKDIGGYENIKLELMQCVDILNNYSKYSKYNVRVPKGLIFEGPPGNGKTLFAKAFAGEARIGFISVAGSEFNEKYIGVGSSRIRELFQLAKNNVPCVIFIDEIDALGRKRSGDGEISSSEKDTTLNELLIALDGFKNTSGIFLIGATNRIDLLDPALLRPGRIDKRIYIGLPDFITRQHILNIHIQGKPYNHSSISINELAEFTKGYSCSQIENFLNEALLHALLKNRTQIEKTDLDLIVNKIVSGWMPVPHKFDDTILYKIVIHEMGHVICGLLSKEHSKIIKVVVNLNSPNMPAYTLFESADDVSGHIYTRISLKEHLIILLAGRIAEEEIFGVSVTTGAINDFEEALKIAQKMVINYGMGTNIIYPYNSDYYKKKIDDEIFILIEDAYSTAKNIVSKYRMFILKGADILLQNKVIYYNELHNLLNQHIINYNRIIY